MRDLVLVPSFFRPEMLHMCLEHLGNAEGGKDKHVWVAQDRHHVDNASNVGYLQEIREVVHDATPKFAQMRYIERQEHRYMGNPYNFLELYKEAYSHSEFRYVYLVEDDVIVAPDFFRWHEAVQAREAYFCSVGWHCTRNPAVKPTNNPHALIESARDFTSVGVCWRREKLHRIVVHGHPSYYENLAGYMKKRFPKSLIPYDKWTEQAGLIMRILLETEFEYVCWAGLRRCSHIGVNGYHRRNGHRFGGDLKHKVAELRGVMGSTEAMVALSTEKYDDIDALPKVGPWTPERLEVVQRFPFDGTYE